MPKLFFEMIRDNYVDQRDYSRAKQISSNEIESDTFDDVRALSCMYMQAGEIMAGGSGKEWFAEQSVPSLGLLVVEKGKMLCRADGNEYNLLPGDCLILLIENELKLSFDAISASKTGTKACLITFSFQPPGHVEVIPEHYLPIGKLIRLKPFPRFYTVAEALCAKFDNSSVRRDALEIFQSHIAFQQLICTIMEQQGPDINVSDSVKAVMKTIDYIQHNFAERLSVQQLANAANLSARQYTRIFKRLTGKAPIEYLHDYRINRSREHLLQSDFTLNSISSHIGIEDVHYFTRLFRNNVGCPPKTYIEQRYLDSQIVTIHYAGECLALGVVPLGEVETTLNQIQYCNSAIASIGKLTPDPLLIKELQPDLIIASDHMQQEYLADIKQFAPVITVPWDIRPFERLQRIAAVLGKQKEAQKWMEEYAEKRKLAADWCKHNIKRQETASLIRLEDGFVWVHASRFFPTFYEVMGFKPTSLMKHSVENSAMPRRVAVSFDQLYKLDADRLYIICGNTDHEKVWLQNMMQTQFWQQLRAVNSNRVYLLRQCGISYDSYTLKWQLDQIDQLWHEPGTTVHYDDHGWILPLET